MDTSKLTKEEALKALLEVEAAEKDLALELEKAKAEDPFWWYEPSDSHVSDAGIAFLKRYLREEDIPQKFDSQKDVHLCTAPTILAGGGNRVGKSTVAPIEVFIHITGELPFAMRDWYPKEKLQTTGIRKVRVLGESADVLKDVVIPKYKEWVPRDYLKNRSWEDSFSREDKVLTLYRTNRPVGYVKFMSYEQQTGKMQGADLTMIVFDEEPPFDIYKENVMRVGSQVLRKMFCMTPTHGMSWVYREVVQKQDESTRCFKMATVTNPHLNYAALKDGLDKIPTYIERKMRLLGEWVSLSGLVYGGLFNRDVHVIKPFPIKREYLVLRGLDPHTAKPTACVELGVDRELNKFVFGCYLAPDQRRNIQLVKEDLAQRAEERKYRLGWSRCDRSADSTNQALSEKGMELNIFKLLREPPNPIQALDKSQKFAGSINAGIQEIMDDLRIDPVTGKPKLFIFDTPENQPLIQAFETLERDSQQNEEKKGLRDRVLEGKHDTHAALRYIYQRRIGWLPPEAQQFSPVEQEDERYV